MRRQLIVKLNCLVLLFVSVGCSYGLDTQYKRVDRSSSLQHPFNYANSHGRTVSDYHVRTQIVQRTVTTNSNNGRFAQSPRFSRTKVTINSDGSETINKNTFGTSGNFPTINGHAVHATHVKQTCHIINGVKKCRSTHQQRIQNINELTITISDLNVNTIIWKLQQLQEFQNERFDVCKCKNYADCRCADKITSYTITNPCYCLCLQERNGESDCLCTAKLIQVQIRSEVALTGCLCYNSDGSGPPLKCKCHKFENSGIYDSNKYTSMEVEVKDTSRIENFRDVILGKFSEKHQGYDYCAGKEFNTGITCTPKYTCNGLSNCLCLKDYILPEFPIRCICNEYILQPKIKYEHGMLQGCYCVFTSSSASICKCYQYIQYGGSITIQPKQIHDAEKIYDYSKVVLVIRKGFTIEAIISNLQQYQEFRNEKIDVCTYSRGRWSLTDKTTIYTIAKPCRCLCLREAIDHKCICNSNILKLQIDSDVNLDSCLCYNIGGVGSSFKCNCRNIKNRGKYDSNKYTSIEIEVKDTTRIENFRDEIFGKFSPEDQGYDYCAGNDFNTSITCVSTNCTHNGLSHCLCLKENIYPEYSIRCLCNEYIFQPKIKCATGNLQRCNCMFGAETICTCKQYISHGYGSAQTDSRIIPYNSEGIYDLVPLGEIVIEDLRRYLQERIEFRNEIFETCYCNSNLECNCDREIRMYTRYAYDPFYCLCLNPKRSLSQVNCLCNQKILKRQFKYSIHLYTLKGCICVRKTGSFRGMSCTCRDIDPNVRIDDNKYSSTVVELPSNTMNMAKIADIIIPKLQEVDKGYDRCNCYSGDSWVKGECGLNYPVNGLSPCLCLKDYSVYINTCICNYYVLQIKIRYNSEIIPLKACYCIPYQGRNKIYCKCSSHSSTEQQPEITTTTTTTTVKPIYYNYEDVLIILPEKELTLNILIHEYLQTIEFSDKEFNSCACEVNSNSKSNCYCAQSTQLCKKETPCNCLCMRPNIENSRKECLCNEYVLKSKISYSTSEITLFDCSCYSYKGYKNPLSCDFCKPKMPYSPDYGSVLINIEQQDQINNEILLNYFQNVEEYRLERFGTCGCTDPQEKLPCSCIRNYHQYGKNEFLNCLCIVYKTNLPKLSQCLSSRNVLLADIKYNTHLIELQECVCNISANDRIDPICNCKRKQSFDPNYNILLEFKNETQTEGIVSIYKSKYAFRHERFMQCEHSHDIIQCPHINNNNHFTYPNCSCLCGTELYNNITDQSKCICSTNVLKPNITYNTEKLLLQDCTPAGNNLKYDCNTKLSYNPYDILLDFHERTVNISIIFRYYQERWEFYYEVFNKCAGIRNQLTLTLKCDEDMQSCTKTTKCNCLCLFHRTNTTAECLCSSNVLRPNITYYSVFNNLQACECYHNDNVQHQICNCTKKLPYEPNFDSILIVLKNEIININMVHKEFQKYWEYRHEFINKCNGSISKSLSQLTCSESTEKCMTYGRCKCLCEFQPKFADCLCGPYILESNITYSTSLNNLQECTCLQDRNKPNVLLLCKCKKKESFEPKYEGILMKFKEVKIYINMILKFLEERWEFQYENFNSCNGTSLQSPLEVNCVKPISRYQNQSCNCLCVLDEAASGTECLCSDHVLQPNITYNMDLNNLQNCKCYQKGNVKSHDLICECVKKVSFEPNYEDILIKWYEIKINVSIILTYFRQRWEYQYEVYKVCKGSNSISPMVLSCEESMKECTENKSCNCLCASHQVTNTIECVCSSYVLLPNITYNTSINDLQGCNCHRFGNDKQLLCSCKKKLSFEPEFDLILIDLHQVMNTISITTIQQNTLKHWEFKHEVFNICKTNKLTSPLKLDCANNVEKYHGKNPCGCLCVFNHMKNDSECLCNSQVLLPNITYNTVVNDLQSCECIHEKVTNDNGKHMMCLCVKKPSFEPRYDLILIEWIEVHIEITIIVTYFEKKWEFQHEVFNLCNGTNLETPLTLACTENTQNCTDEYNCNCLCIFHQNSSNVDCLCNRHILLPNITYSDIENDLQECMCVYKNDSKAMTCNCNKKISFNPNYNILIESEEITNISIIHSYLKQRWEFQYEAFNLCSKNSSNSRFTCTENTMACTKENNCSCLCTVHQITNLTDCLCSSHVLLPNITYNTNLNNLQQCGCVQIGDFNQMTCKCIKKPSFEPRFDFLLINFYSIKIYINIVLTYVLEKWEFKYEEFKHCKGTNEKSSLTLICMEETKNCTWQNYCNCLCVFHNNTSAVECLCSLHILMPNITYNTSENNLQGCVCLNNDKADQMSCNCSRKPSFEPKYELVLIKLIQIKIKINIILQYLEETWQFQHEVFNLCSGVGLVLPLTVNCTNDVLECTENTQCNCLCALDEATTASECLCSPNVLLPNITYNTNVNNLQECSCSHKENINQLICSCLKKVSYEPKYDLILMEFPLVQIYISMIVMFLQERWEFQHEVFNLCEGKSSGQLTCQKEAAACAEENKCNCLCAFQSNATECACSTNILLPNITYSMTLNNIQECKCINKDNIDQIKCNCTKKPSFEPKYNLTLFEWHNIKIEIIFIINYLQQMWEFRYEVFNQCNGTNVKADLELTCNQTTELCTEKDRCNCLCVFYQSKNSTECLCSTHILLPNITYNADQNDLQGCFCTNKEKTNNLLCKCVKKPSFEPRYDLILLGPYEYVEITVILTYLKQIWQFQYEAFNLCKGTHLISPLTLMCTNKTETCTNDNNCNCLCSFHHSTSASDCLCSPHVLLPNITYVESKNDIQACTCVYKGDTNYVTCNCNKKPPFDPSYKILIEWKQKIIDIPIILTYLRQRWEFQYEVFNICKGTKLTTNLTCTENTNACTEKNCCNCLCMVYRTDSSECLCSPHVLLPNMTYSTGNNIQDCCCFQKGNSNQLMCNCTKKESFEPRYNLMLIEVKEVKINIKIKIILTYFQERWEFYHEDFNHCTGSNSKAIVLLTCDNKTEKCVGKNYCNCLCEFLKESPTVDCYCNAKVLLPNITYNTNSIDLRGCTCLNKDKPNQMSCNCVKKLSFEPKYDTILIEMDQMKIRIFVILQFLEQMWEFQYEVFDRCIGTNLTSSLTIDCQNKTHICTQNNSCSCLCAFDHMTITTECLCSPHVLLPNITYNATQNDLQGCHCFYKDNNNLMTCSCEKKPSFEPKYDILIVWEEMKNNMTILLTYLQQRWEFQYDDFNLCKSSSLESPLTLTCKNKTELCTEENQCNCLCASNDLTDITECLCSPHVLLPNITYNDTQNDIQECICFYKSNTNQLTCNCETKPSFDPSYDILIIWKELHFNIEILRTYLQEMWEFQYEVFNVCNSSSLESPLILSCPEQAQNCTENNNCNCLCVFNHVNNKTECLCSSNILLLDITYDVNLHDLRGCVCVNKTNQLSYKCEKKPSFEPRYDFLIDWSDVELDITIIFKYFEELLQFRHEIFNLCESTNLKPSLTLNCTENTQMCTEKDQCNCLCLFDHPTGEKDCLCGEHVLLPNITYGNTTYDLQECKCIQKIYPNELTCNCEKKPSFDPNYSILIQLQQEVIYIYSIFVYLLQRWEFQYEDFNVCNGTGLTLNCTKEIDFPTRNNTCNCLCVLYQATNAKECLCSTHILLLNITYNTAKNNLEKCHCFLQKGNLNELACNCVNKTSFEPNYNALLLEFQEGTITAKIILKYLKNKWEFQYETFNQCNGTNPGTNLTLTCVDNTQLCTKNESCNCLCVFADGVECLCSLHILLPNMTYTSSKNNLQGCICNNKNINQLDCYCKKKEAFEPKYDFVLIDLSQVTIYINIILQYLEKIWEFQYEVFNICMGFNLKLPLNLTCLGEVNNCLEGKGCNCLCLFDHANDQAECLCSHHVLMPNITYDITQYDLQACTCFVSHENQSICNCERKPSYDPKYEQILILWQDIWIDITIITTYVRQKWEFQHETFILCKGNNLKLPLTLNCNDTTETCTDKNHCSCLCIIHQNTSITDCLCSNHILLPNITYNTTTNDLQGCNCTFEGDANLLTCKCEKKLSFNPRYDILIDLHDIEIDSTSILTCLQQKWEFTHEPFTQCNGTTPLLISCEENTELCVETNHCNCLCAQQKISNNNAVKCLCSPHVLLLKIKYDTSKNDLQGCNCLHTGGANNLECKCVEILSFDPNYNLILIELLQIQIDISIIHTKLLERWELVYEDFNECSGLNLNPTLILNCEQKTDVYVGNNRSDCICIFYHETSTTQCLCSSHASLITFTYNATTNDIQDCSCQYGGSSYQLTCDCKKKESFEPTYFILFDTKKVILTIKFIQEFFNSRMEFRFEAFTQISCKTSKLPLSCTWTDKKAISSKETSCNCLCILSAFSNRAANCLCSKHVLIPDIIYNTKENNLQSCICNNTLEKLDQLSCECTPKESFNPNYGEVKVNLGSRQSLQIIIIEKFLKLTKAFRYEVFNRCNCIKENLMVSCICQNETKSFTVQKPADCLCTWLSDESETAQCLCNDHILDVKYTFTSPYLKLANCSFYNSVNYIRYLAGECDEMASVEKRYANFTIQVPEEYIEINNLAKFISTNFTNRDKFFKICTNKNYRACLYNVSEEKKPEPCLCLSSKFEHNNGCVYSLYIIQPMILYDDSKYKLYKCYFESNWRCQLVNDKFAAQKHANYIKMKAENTYITTVQNVTKYVVGTNFWNSEGPQFENRTIIRNITRYVTNTTYVTYNPGNLNIKNYTTVHKVTRYVTSPNNNV